MDADDPLPIDVTQITPTMVIAEIVMKREITPTLDAARARGCRIVLGREMLQEQMPLYLEFFGLTPQPTQHAKRIPMAETKLIHLRGKPVERRRAPADLHAARRPHARGGRSPSSRRCCRKGPTSSNGASTSSTASATPRS